MSKKLELIKDELLKRFEESTHRNKTIEIEMKADGQVFKIMPEWLFGQDKEIELANGFAVYAKVPEGLATAPFMSSLNLNELAGNIALYTGMINAQSCLPMYLYVTDNHGGIQMIEYHKYY